MRIRILIVALLCLPLFVGHASPRPQTGNQVLYFGAAWCGPCRQFKRDQMSALKHGLEIRRAGLDVIDDADPHSKEYRKAWQVTSYPTIILVRTTKEGRAVEIRRWKGYTVNGGPTASHILQHVGH